MTTKKDFTQVAFDVVRRATGETPQSDPKTAKRQAAPKVSRGAVKKTAKKG